jgi:hypothetical protein
MLLLELAAETKRQSSPLYRPLLLTIWSIAIAQSGAGGFFKETQKKMPNTICREPTAETDEKQILPEAGNSYNNN